MDPLTVLIIAVVTFVVFVLLTAYFLKMAILVGKESAKASSDAGPGKDKVTTAEEDNEDISSE